MLSFSHDWNEIAEWAIQTVKKMTMFLLMQIRFSTCFWTEAVTTAIYFWNQLSIRIFLTEMISLVTVYSECKFDQYSHFKFFDCLCYMMILKDKQKNWQFKSRMCIFLSYVWNSITVYKVMNLTIYHIFMTVDIQWDEKQFSDMSDQILINVSSLTDFSFSADLSLSVN